MTHSARSSRLCLLLLAGCGSVFTEIDEPQVCQTLPNQVVPGVPANTVNAVAVPLVFNLHRELGNTAGISGQVEVLQVTLTADTGITDFSFIQSAQLDIDVPDGGGTYVNAVQYQQPAPYTPSSALEMPGNGANVFDEMGNGLVSATLDLTGTFPTAPWTTDIQVCVEVELDE